MRYSVIVILLFAATEAVLAPDSEELHKLYGESRLVSSNPSGNPDSESFHLQGDIYLTVLYGSDHRACLVELTPERPLLPQRPYYEMSAERVSEILEEIAPSAKRGEFWMVALSARVTGIAQGRLRVPANNATPQVWGRRFGIQCNSQFKRDVCPKP